MKKVIFGILYIVLAAEIGAAVFSSVSFNKEFIIEEQTSSFFKSKSKPEIKDTLTFMAVGDIMLDRGVEFLIKKEGEGDFKFPFLKISEELKKADILFGNLEGPISDKGQNVGSIYSFRSDPKAIEGLKYVGFDVLSLANNHILDYGGLALIDTLQRLKKAKIDYVGAGLNEEEAFSLKTKTVAGTKFGFLAYTNLGEKSWRAAGENLGMAWVSEEDIEKIKKDIEEAKQKVDILVVSLHAGNEYEFEPTPFQISFATAFIEAGADLVIGHHPHVVQKLEKFKNGWVAYSLGNFVFDQSFSSQTMEGAVLEAEIKDKKINKVALKKIKISDSFQPYFVKNYYLKDFLTEKKDDFLSAKTDFLEVNLSEAKIKVYQEGDLAKEVPILNKGDPEFWGGTPLGVYNVIYKQKLGFSSIANVNMPWNINFYGKYNIHGQPYFSGGELFNLGYSGGCIQLLNNDAKALYDLVKQKMPILVVGEKGYGSFNPPVLSEIMERIPKVEANSYLVADLDSGFVFSEKNSQIQLPIASLVKLMEAIVVAENVNLRDSIAVSQAMLSGYGSTKGLVAGGVFRVVELFYPLLIESSNDAAEVLSSFLGRKRTVDLMNEKAKMIGMENTVFTDPTGYDPKNISTAKDLFYLAKYLLNARPPILKITKGERVESFGEVKFKDLDNKNIFFDAPNFIGGKSGYIISSKYTGLFLFSLYSKDDEERNIAIIILGSENLENDVKNILEWLVSNHLTILPK